MSWAHLKRTGKKGPNQCFELREAPLDFPVPHEDGTGGHKDPDTKSPRRFVRSQRDNRDRGEFGRRECQEKFRRYPLRPMKPVSSLSAGGVTKPLVTSPSTLEEGITTDPQEVTL